MKKLVNLNDFLRRTLPFIVVGLTFMCLAYSYGNILNPKEKTHSFEIIKMCMNNV